jgi:hypothetical protein
MCQPVCLYRSKKSLLKNLRIFFLAMNLMAYTKTDINHRAIGVVYNPSREKYSKGIFKNHVGLSMTKAKFL